MPVQTALVKPSYKQRLLRAFEEKIRKAGKRSPLRIVEVGNVGFILRHIEGYEMCVQVHGREEPMIIITVYTESIGVIAILVYLITYQPPEELVEVVWGGEIWDHIQVYKNPRFFHDPEQFKEELKYRYGLLKVY